MNVIIVTTICLFIILSTGTLNSSTVRVAQHRTTLFHDDNLPKWWPSQKRLSIATVVFNWLMIIATLGNCVWLIVISHPDYIISFAIAGFICWIVGRFLGLEITSALIRARSKKDGIEVIHECL